MTSLKFPEELLRSPRCLIALSGLDKRNNAVHRAIWDEFTSGGRRSERKPVRYIAVSADHLYPKASPPINYEDFTPSGILKTAWLHKHSQLMPSLVVFFFDLDWDDGQWEEKETECASKIQVIRASLEGRASEIVIVLLQTTPPVPVGDANSQTSERAAALCSLCGLPRLNLYALPFTDRPLGFIIKLEEVFYKKSLQYYSNQISKIKSHKDLLPKVPLSSSLLIRHQFKIAFFTEMRQDSTSALKLYRAAYSLLQESMFLNEDKIMEYKLIAGFLNCKICQLCFEVDEPLSAIQQFRKHVDRFSKEMGPRSLSYQHFEWMSRQFSAFADIFSDAVQRGLKAIQTQNPGLYYHQAATFAIQRKKQTYKQTLGSSSSSSYKVDILPVVTYYGQRPWRVGLTDDKQTDKESRLKCIAIMQEQEWKTEHSWLIIPLLSNAVTHFKTHNSERMIALLKVLMGEEYYQVKEYKKALVLLRGVVETYRREQWWKALSLVLQTLFRCAYMLGHLQDYFMFGLELISRYLPLPVSDKTRVQQNIMAIFSGQAPDPEPGVDRDTLLTAYQLWEGLDFSGQPCEFAVQASSCASFIECKTMFEASSLRADSCIELHVYLRSTAPLPVTLSKLMVLFYQGDYNKLCVVKESFTLEVGVVKTFSFSFPVIQATVGDRLEVHAVEVLLGREGQRSATLLWSNGVSEKYSSLPEDPAWRRVPVRNSTLIKSRPPNIEVSVEHLAPALTSEYFFIRLSVENNESRDLRDLRVGVALSDPVTIDGQSTADLYLAVPHTPTLNQNKQSVELMGGALGKGAKFSETIYLSSHIVGERSISVSTSYDILCDVKEGWEPVVCTCQKDITFKVATVKPFDVTYKLLNLKFRNIESVHFDEPFFLCTEIHSTSPWKLLIENSIFHLPASTKDVGPTSSQIEGLELGAQDRASECRCVVAATPPSRVLSAPTPAASVSLGTYTVQWRRCGSVNVASEPQSSVMTSTVTLPPVPSRTLPFSISTNIPASGMLHIPFLVSYTLHNKTLLVQDIEARVSTSEAFMYSGKRTTRFRVLPSSSHTLNYHLYPVLPGMVPLPHLELTYQRDPKAMELVTGSKLPTSIFIKPSAIGRESKEHSFSLISFQSSSSTTSS